MVTRTFTLSCLVSMNARGISIIARYGVNDQSRLRRSLRRIWVEKVARINSLAQDISLRLLNSFTSLAQRLLHDSTSVTAVWRMQHVHRTRKDSLSQLDPPSPAIPHFRPPYHCVRCVSNDSYNGHSLCLDRHSVYRSRQTRRCGDDAQGLLQRALYVVRLRYNPSYSKAARPVRGVDAKDRAMSIRRAVADNIGHVPK